MEFFLGLGSALSVLIKMIFYKNNRSPNYALMYCSEHVSNWLQIQWLNFISSAVKVLLIEIDWMASVQNKQPCFYTERLLKMFGLQRQRISFSNIPL